MLADDVKRAIEQRTADIFAHMVSDVSELLVRRGCLYWACSCAHALQEFGFASCINAGTAGFMAGRDDAGLYELEYRWTDPKPIEAATLLAAGALPEMHVWACVPELKLLVDPTYEHQPHVAESMGLDWNMPKPSGWLWANSSLPDGVRYEPSDRATRLAYHLLTFQLKGRMNEFARETSFCVW